MKATTIIIAAVFSLQFSAVSADNPEGKYVNESYKVNVSAINLAPVTPSEADFSDAVPEPVVKAVTLAPVTPSEADFNDDLQITNVSENRLAPSTPSTADFDDIVTFLPVTNILLPVAPSKADFD